MNELLASYQLHYQKLRNFHWNLRSQDFFVLHEKFEQFYTDANTKIDDIAERILTLRVKPISQLSEYLKISQIKEISGNLDETEMVQEILNDFSTLIRLGRNVTKAAAEAEDEGTIDMLGSYIGDLEKNCWMLSSYLEKNKPKKVGMNSSDDNTALNTEKKSKAKV
ncbi:ferritin Dps family protein [Flammeovirgaceae bacterium 311]|nr:ferritin Dps family protein [Flammeovirgaceae bacterium 311]